MVHQASTIFSIYIQYIQAVRTRRTLAHCCRKLFNVESECACFLSLCIWVCVANMRYAVIVGAQSISRQLVTERGEIELKPIVDGCRRS